MLSLGAGAYWPYRHLGTARCALCEIWRVPPLDPKSAPCEEWKNAYYAMQRRVTSALPDRTRLKQASVTSELEVPSEDTFSLSRQCGFCSRTVV